MNRRVLYGVGLLVVLVGLAGCGSILGPGSVDEGELAADPGVEYQWDSGADGYVEVYRNNYTAVYSVANRTTGRTEAPYSMELYTRDALGTEQPLNPASLQFRYENGTVLRFVEEDGEANLVMLKDDERVDVEDSLLTVNRTRKRTQVFVPTNESGQLAFVGPKNGKQIATPRFVSGSYEMVLPEDAEVGIPVLSQVQPGQTDTRTVDGRVHVYWEEVTRAPSVVVRYYLGRDLLLFGGLLVLLVVVGGIGAVYYYLQIRETVRRRDEVGLDVDTGDDSGGGGGPPGFG